MLRYLLILIVPANLLAQAPDSTRSQQIGIDFGAGFGFGENFGTTTCYSVSFQKVILQIQNQNFYSFDRKPNLENTTFSVGYRLYQDRRIMLKGLAGLGNLSSGQSNSTTANFVFEIDLMISDIFAFEQKTEVATTGAKTIPYIGIGFRIGLLNYHHKTKKRKP